MTIAAGILCSDGIVLGADTEHTGPIKQLGPKAWGFSWVATGVGIGMVGAGDSILLGSIRDKTSEAVLDEPPTSGRAALALIERTLLDVYTNHVFPHPGCRDNTYGLQLILGIRDQRGFSLYESAASSFSKVGPYSCVGAGADLGSYLLDTMIGPDRSEEIWSRRRKEAIDTHRGMQLLVYVLKQAKRYSPYCGGTSNIIVAKNNGETHFVNEHVIAALERAFDHGLDLRGSVLSIATEYEESTARIRAAEEVYARELAEREQRARSQPSAQPKPESER